jgi:peroxiredoxin
MHTTRTPLALALSLAAFVAMPTTVAHAELAEGAIAPAFVTQAARAGKPFTFDLKAALKNGPVVLYFFPKVFTQGCTLEAHAFAEAIEDYRKAGATVIGMSGDDIESLAKFSTLECRDKFPVGVASARIIKDYDVALGTDGGRARRTSYVIARDGRIRLVYANMDYRDHVKKTLAQVEALKGR